MSEGLWMQKANEATAERDRYREALERIACESHPDTMEDISFGRALGRVHDIARRVVDPPVGAEAPDA